MSVRPNPPTCETWMAVIAVEAMAPNVPARSRIKRLPCESAIGRNPMAVLEGGSTRTTFNPRPRRARANVAPTGPPPAMRTSHAPGRIAHECFDVFDSLGCVGCQDFTSVRGDERVVFDAHADVPEALGDALAWPHVATGLDRERHSRLERLPLAALLVVTGVVHIEPEPMAGAVHVKAPVFLLLEHRI